MSAGHWTQSQRDAIYTRGRELAVSASAGSGKTSVLVERVLCAALGLGCDAEGNVQRKSGSELPVDSLLIVTFTNAAAAELRARLHERLSAELEVRLGDPREAGLLRRQLAALPLAQIGTLHGYCLELVRRYGYLQGLTAGRVLSEQESQLSLHEQATRFLDEQLGSSQAALLRMALDWGGMDGVGADDISQQRASRGLRTLLLLVYELQRSLPDPQAWYGQHLDFPPLDPERFDPQHPLIAPLVRQLAEDIAAQLNSDDELLSRLQNVPAKEAYPHLLARRRSALQRSSLELGWNELREHLEIHLEVKQDDLHYKPSLLGKNYRSVLDAEDPLREEVRRHKENTQLVFSELDKLIEQDWPLVAAQENHVLSQLRLLWQLALDFDTRYGRYKRERGWLDYGDMERGALSLLVAVDEDGLTLRDDAGRLQPSSVALEQRLRFSEVLVDEYQDTSPLQDAILELVTPELPLNETLGFRPRFVVGDVKQSIYSFRLAEPALFIQLKQRMEELGRAATPAGSLISLRENFRSRSGVLAAVNALLRGLLSQELGGEDYSRAELIYAADYESHEPAASEPAGPACRLSLVREEERTEAELEDTDGDELEGTIPDYSETADELDGGDVSDDSPELQRAVYRRCALLIRELAEQGERAELQVLDRSKAGGKALRPAHYGDIVILLRSSRGRVEMLREELERAGVPCLAAGRSGFYERPEVLDALSLLRVIDNPLQDVPLAAVLHGPVCGLSAEELLRVSRPETFCVPAAAGAEHESEAAAKAAAETCPDSRAPLLERITYSAAHQPEARLRERLNSLLARLARWRELAREEPLHLLLHRLYLEAGLLPAAAAQKRGSQREANLAELLRLARDYSAFERQGIARFLQFIDDSHRAAGDAGEAVLAGASLRQVRIMTVHQSKGLEFPIVVLPDLQRSFNERDISSSDLLWHFRGGLAGRFYDLTSRRPRRADTLGLRRLRRLKRLELRSEELRMLYVAMTRARERLELVAGVKLGYKLADKARQEAVEASSWLDWLAQRWGPALAHALDQGQASVGAAGHSIVAVESVGSGQLVTTAAEADSADSPALASLQGLLDSKQLPAILATLQWSYPQAAALALPGKITVSRLAKQAVAFGDSSEPGSPAGDSDSEVVLADEVFAKPATELLPTPWLLSAAPAQSRPDARARGTATHRLLAELDPLPGGYLPWAEPQRLTALRERLVADGQIEPEAAGLIRLDQISRFAREIDAVWQRLPGEGQAQALRELPIGLLVPAAEAAATLGQVDFDAEDQAVAADQVYVQGTIDLLLLTESSALIVDYKTDHAASAETLLTRYQRQLEWYCRGVAALLPGRELSWALYGLDGAGLIGPFAYDHPPGF